MSCLLSWYGQSGLTDIHRRGTQEIRESELTVLERPKHRRLGKPHGHT